MIDKTSVQTILKDIENDFGPFKLPLKHKEDPKIIEYTILVFVGPACHAQLAQSVPVKIGKTVPLDTGLCEATQYSTAYCTGRLESTSNRAPRSQAKSRSANTDTYWI